MKTSMGIPIINDRDEIEQFERTASQIMDLNVFEVHLDHYFSDSTEVVACRIVDESTIRYYGYPNNRGIRSIELLTRLVPVCNSDHYSRAYGYSTQFLRDGKWETTSTTLEANNGFHVSCAPSPHPMYDAIMRFWETHKRFPEPLEISAEISVTSWLVDGRPCHWGTWIGAPSEVEVRSRIEMTCELQNLTPPAKGEVFKVFSEGRKLFQFRW